MREDSFKAHMDISLDRDFIGETASVSFLCNAANALLKTKCAHLHVKRSSDYENKLNEIRFPI
jgi:hypothetical protein